MSNECFGSLVFEPVVISKASKPMPTTATIRLSMSRDGYKTKEAAKKSLTGRGKNRIAFKERTFNLLELSEYIKNGYVFAHCYHIRPYFGWMNSEKAAQEAIKHIGVQRAARAIARKAYLTAAGWVFKKGDVSVAERAEKTSPIYQDGFWNIRYKCELYWDSADVVFVDIDHTSYTNLTDFTYRINRVIPYTIAYATYSDKPDSRRFRLVYFLDKKVSHYDVFQLVSTYIHNKVSEALGEPISDSCGTAPTQQFYGTNSTEVITQNYCIDVDTAFNEQTKGLNTGLFLEEDGSYSIDVNNLTVENLFDDNVTKAIRFSMLKPNEATGFKPNSVKQTMWKIRHEYNCKIFSRTDVDFQGKRYALTPEGHLSLLDLRDANGKLRRYKDGEHRKRKLYTRTLLRRYMSITHKMNVTPTDLLANIYTDLVNIIDNSDNDITFEILKATVIRVLVLSEEDVIAKVENYYNKFFCNKESKFVMNSEGLSESERAVLRNESRTEITFSSIEKYYDKSKTVKENLKILEDNGVKVSEVYLYKWAKRNNIDTVKSNAINIDEELLSKYDPNLSIRKNAEVMGVSKKIVEKIIKLLKNS